MNIVFGGSLCILTTALGLFVKYNWPAVAGSPLGISKLLAALSLVSRSQSFTQSSALNCDIFLILF